MRNPKKLVSMLLTLTLAIGTGLVGAFSVTTTSLHSWRGVVWAILSFTGTTSSTVAYLVALLLTWCTLVIGA